MYRIRTSTGKAIFVLSLIILALATTAMANNIRFFTIVQQFLNNRRVSVIMERMQIEVAPDGTNTFSMVLESRRNNFEEVMIYGYLGVGQAIARTDQTVNIINITVSIPKADNMLIMTTADASLVEQLRQGKLKSSAFIRQLQWN